MLLAAAQDERSSADALEIGTAECQASTPELNRLRQDNAAQPEGSVADPVETGTSACPVVDPQLGRNMQGNELFLHPFDVHFTHGAITCRFRDSEQPLDDAIQQIEAGQMQADTFPDIEVTWYGSQYYSLSNRRLFVFRVLANLGDRGPRRRRRLTCRPSSHR